MNKVLIEDMSWPEFKLAMVSNDLIIVPAGSTEAHGPHNPLGTDTLIAENMALKTGERLKAPVAPCLPVGNASSLVEFPGTAHIDPQLLSRVLFQVCESFVRHGARRFLFINGHGGNSNSLSALATELYDEFGVMSTGIEWWKALPKLGDFHVKEHGGFYESSLAMLSAEELVDLSRLPGEQSKAEEMSPVASGEFQGVPLKRPYAMRTVYPAGYHGLDTPKASVEVGTDVLERYVEFCVGLGEELRKIPL